MISITKDEAAMLRSRGRWADIHMSSRNKKGRGKRYFLTESPKSMKILNDYRSSQLIATFDGR